MNELLRTLHLKLGQLASSDEGQDLVEYGLVLALVALGSIAVFQSYANGIANAYVYITAQFTAAVS
ncbi:MAG TPA: hypothetical protein VMA34_21445 [Terracidiphilus sp.]|nr:hypothetical protein [Terracidiphilus sp.]